MSGSRPSGAVEAIRDLIGPLRQGVHSAIPQRIIGHDQVFDPLLVALLCEGHVLLEDVPGLGKTQLVKAFAELCGLTVRRIQGTPDLLPTDITGYYYPNPRTGEAEFRPGPVFANVVLFDEINRAVPRTQSALLEAMAEGQVTLDGRALPLPRPFYVLATQNPIELDGTNPLPEAQLDRFLLRLRLGYPRPADEKSILRAWRRHAPPLRAVADERHLLACQSAVEEVIVRDPVIDYIERLVQATRNSDRYGTRYGLSTRGALALRQAAQALAALAGRVQRRRL